MSLLSPFSFSPVVGRAILINYIEASAMSLLGMWSMPRIEQNVVKFSTTLSVSRYQAASARPTGPAAWSREGTYHRRHAQH